MMKILVYGSTFNPVHLGHINSLEYACQKNDFDKVIIVPNYQGHFKNNKSVARVEDRLAMLQLALKNLKIDYELSLLEISQQKKIYTFDLIKQLQKQYPQASFTFLIGSDQAQLLDKWHRIDELVKIIEFMIVKRDQDYINDEYQVLDNQVLDYSSTRIRETYETSGIASVDLYIREQGLYLEELVSNKMKEKRFKHVLNVASLCVATANRYHLDEKKAYIAGMLHDICKEMPLAKQYALVAQRESFEVNDATVHSYAAYYYCLETLQIKDQDVLNAIKKHTSADFMMSDLDKLVYVCDMLSYERDFVGVEDLRKLLESDLNECFKQCFLQSYQYLIIKNVFISEELNKLKEMIERDEV